MSNLDIWNGFSETNPKYTKPFKRPGGFSGTAINPMYTIRKMTEKFGACGTGWGTDSPEFTFKDGAEGTVLVFCKVAVWYVVGESVKRVYGVGGDFVVGKNSYGLKSDDEACKKSFTDGIMNAFKFLGIGADIHMGMYDDNKYINDMKAKYGDGKEERLSSVADGNHRSGNKAIDKLVNDSIRIIANAVNLEDLKISYKTCYRDCEQSGAHVDQLALLEQQKDTRKEYLTVKENA